MSTFTDLEKDAVSVDGFVNENALIVTRRNGPKPSWQYIVDQVYAQLGYAVVGSFVDGFTYTGIRQVGVDASGNTWIYTGGQQNIPHTVDAGTIPSEPEYFQVSVNSADNVVLDNGENLQQAIDRLNDETEDLPDLIRAFLITQGLSGNYGFFEKGFTYNEVGDVGIATDGGMWTYVGSGSLPVNVAGGTNPVGDVNYKQIKFDAASRIHLNQGGFVQEAIDYVTPEMYGAKEGEDALIPLNNMFASGIRVVMGSVKYLVSGEVVKEGASCVDWNGCTIDGSLITDDSIRSVLSIRGDDTKTQLPSMAVDLIFADRNITFSEPHGLSVGDWFVIYDPRDYSYSPARVGYKAGEFMQVKSIVSSTEIVISGTVYSKTGYLSAECELYKVSKTSFSFIGAPTVVTPNTNKNIRAISVSDALDTDISNFKGVADGGVIGIVISQSINVSGNGVVGSQSGNVAVDYGLAAVSSQHINISGNFTARRHGFTTAEQNYGDVGVVCRDIHMDGYFASYDQDLASADTHGNSEYVKFTGTIDGGLNLRGNHLSCHARIFADKSGRCVQFSELVGYDFDISGSYLYGSNKDSAWGVISSGYLATTVANDYPETIGGLLNMKNVTIDAPNASILVSILKKKSLATDVSVDLRGLNIVNSKTFPIVRFVDSTTTGKFSLINMEGVRGLGSDINLTGSRVSKVIGRVTGVETLTTEGDNRASSIINFGISFGLEYTPTVFTSITSGGNVDTEAGSTFIIPFGVNYGTINAQATVGFGSANNENMTSGQSRSLSWFAE